MKQKVLSAMALMTLVVVGLLLPAPASAAPGGQVHRVSVPFMDFGPNGFGGVSCPEGTTVVTGGYNHQEGVELLDVKVDAAMEPDTKYPHYTTKPGETGWYVQNGEQAQKLSVWAECKSPLAVATPQKPAYKKPTCEATGVVTLRTTEGVKYTTKRNVTDGVTVSATVTASAEPGYVLEPGKGKTWTFAVAKLTEGCEQPPALTVVKLDEAKPTFTMKCEKGKTEARYTEPSANVAYTFVRYNEGKAEIKGVIKDATKYVFEGIKIETLWALPFTMPTCERPGGGTPPTGTPTASASPSDSLSPAAGVVGGSDGNGSGSLPLTGPKVLGMFGFGGLLVAVGGLMLLRLRNRRDQEPGMHRTDGDTQVFPAI